MKKIVVLVALLLLPVVYAQLDWAITDLRCDDGKLDDFELCEPDFDGDGYCEDLAGLDLTTTKPPDQVNSVALTKFLLWRVSGFAISTIAKS